MKTLIAIAAVLLLLLSAGLAQAPSREQPAEREALFDQLDEARANAELLSLELDALKNQAQMQVQMLTQRRWMGMSGFGMGGMGMMGGGMRSTPPQEVNPDEPMKQAEAEEAARQAGYESLKKTILETSRKLGRERRKVAELEERLNERPSRPADRPDIDRRLKSVEQKLDKVLKELAASKDN